MNSLFSHHLQAIKAILLALVLFSLPGCSNKVDTTAIAVLPVDCKEPGTSIAAEIPDPLQGYTYRYRVYLPPCYDASTKSQYPVLYLVPGRSSSPDSWFAAGLLETVDGLILAGDIPPLIIVATQNIENDPTADTIYKELLPWIESQYPVQTNREYRAVAGGSLGGIAAYRLAFQYPDVFSSAGIFGAGAISGEETRIQSWLSSMTDHNRVRVFMDCGDEDVLMLERAQVMKSLLDGAQVDNLLHTGSGGHNYAYWVSNFGTYLRWLAADW